MNERGVVYYFIVQAKCGHVGKGKYIPIDFPIRAMDARRAAFLVRLKPGVKHHQSNAILSVRKVSVVEYLLYRRLFRDDVYWQLACKNYEALIPRIRDEEAYYRVDKPSKIFRGAKKTNKKDTRGFRARKISLIEKSIRMDIIREYGMTV
jgi:hypothetical protein